MRRSQMQSIWSKEVEFPRRAPLSGDMETNTAVIGGGMAGILIAYYLQQKGVPVVILEANCVGSGQTRNTTAKITSQHGLIYDKLIKSFGLERARQYAKAGQEAIAAYRRLIEEKGIDCDFENIPAYLYTETNEAPLIREADAAQRLGIAAGFTTKTTLPFAVKGAVRFENQAQFHPLKFLKAIAGEVTVYEHTSVLRVQEHVLETNRGNVSAKHIVFACHYPFVNFPGLFFARLHQERSYVVALKNAWQMDGAYLGVDSDGHSFRNAGDLLLLGGEGHRTGEIHSKKPYASLLKNAKHWYPDCTEAARWSAQDCMTIDGLPCIGRYASSKPDWFVATGFQKWGMTNSMVAARCISDLICGGEGEGIFSPQRFNLRASAKKLAVNIGQSAKGLTKSVFGVTFARPEDLPCGHGGIVQVHGKKIGAYKDEAGKLYMVSVCCPHLGCQLEWNPAERSWDCPCHGSRYDYTGRLISGPAQRKSICLKGFSKKE